MNLAREVVRGNGRRPSEGSGATIIYTIPTPEDSPIGAKDAAEVALKGRVRRIGDDGGPCGDRTHDTRIKSPVLYQLS